jgi:hypothetical protein
LRSRLWSGFGAGLVLSLARRVFVADGSHVEELGSAEERL